jgi:hypothetical protein
MVLTEVATSDPAAQDCCRFDPAFGMVAEPIRHRLPNRSTALGIP